MWLYLKNSLTDRAEIFYRHISQGFLRTIKFLSQNIEPLGFYESSNIGKKEHFCQLWSFITFDWNEMGVYNFYCR
jgi:hypothetical protein